MKKVFILFITVLTLSFADSQNFTDAIRYAQDEINGTARFRALGGAFGALGGDLSAVNLNPASSSIFNNSKVTFSLGSTKKRNDADYFNRPRSVSETSFNLQQGGGVFVFSTNDPNTKWNKFSIGIVYDRTGDFNDNWIVSGVNPNNSIANYFLDFAQGERLDEISAFAGETISQAYSDIGSVFGFGNQQAFLGFESFILEPANNSDDNTLYASSISGGNYDQQYVLNSTGYNGKTAINFSTEYDDKLNLGINVNAHFLNYERVTVFDEFNNNVQSTVFDVGFDNTLLTTGAGFSFQLGSIYKVTKALRVGFTYNSSTWYRISEETTQFIQTRVDGIANPVVISPNVVNIFPEYRLKTPSKVTASMAYVFAERGLLSFDYSRKDFSQTEFRPTNDSFFASQNTIISNLLGVANTYRFGGEFRANQFSFRGGYRIEESPYKDNQFGGDLTAYSLGLGCKFGDFTVDLAYSQGQRDRNELLFANSPSFNESAQIDTKFTDFTLSVTFGI